jgi:glycosyltransferase involved in cell wall biosynthesis
MAFGHLGWAAQEAAAQAGVPFVCTPFVHPRQWGDGPDDVAYYKRSKAIVALVETDRKYLASLGIDPRVIRVIGVSPELPTTTDPAGFRQRHGLGTAPVVLYVGRMMPQKGAAAVLAGAPLIWRNHPEVRFVFIGPATVPEAAQFQNVDRRISYLGRVSVQEKADALAACDVFCMPSISEILPTVYLEAWNFGKPVVGGLAHGLLELVEGANAGLVSSQEPPELAATLCRLLADADLRIKLGSNGRALVELKYSVAAVTSSLLEMYQQVANLRPTRLPE